MQFDAFFHAATGNPPYDYQRRLACGEPTRPEPAERGRTVGAASSSQNSDSASQIAQAVSPACASRLISVPTGLGKVALDLISKRSILLQVTFICSPSETPQGPDGVIFSGGADAR